MTTLNRIPLNLSLSDVLDLHKKDIFLNFNCHHMGTIQTFDSSKQTATVSINYKKEFFNPDLKTKQYIPTLVDYPLLADCPVVFLGGGQACLTFPVAQGDECLVLFNDRDIDLWFNSNNNAAPNSSRLHSFSDGLILVGIRSLTKLISNFDNTRGVLRWGDPTVSGSMVGVNQTHVKIANNLTTLNTLLQSLITQIQLITVPVAGVSTGGSDVTSGPPVNAAALAMIATQIGGLLE